MATLSSQIANLSPTQKSNLQGRMGPILKPLVKTMPFAAPLIDGVLSASASGLALAMQPVEGFLPDDIKNMIQGAINAILGPSTVAPTSTSPFASLTQRNLSPTTRITGTAVQPIATSGGGGVVGPAYEAGSQTPFIAPQPWYASTGAKIALAVGGAFVGFKLLTKKKKKK